MNFKKICGFLLCGLVLLTSGLASASDTADRLQMTVRRLNAWIGVGPNAENWRRHLWINMLETQAALGDRADLGALRELQRRFSDGTPGLQHPAFQDVRTALTRHIECLGLAQAIDVNNYLMTAEQNFAAPSISEIEPYRLEAIYSLELFREMTIRQRGKTEADKIFTELRVLETLAALRSIDTAALLPFPFATASADVAEPQPQGPFSPEPTSNTASPTDDDDDAKEKARLELRRNAITPLVQGVQQFNDRRLEYQDVYFTSAQIALDRYARVLLNATDRKLNESVARSLKTLQENWGKLAGPDSRTAAAQIGSALGALETTLQHRPFIAAVRRQLSHPNAWLEINARVLQERITRNNSQVRPVDEIILGRQINGTAVSRANVSLDLLPDPYQVSASIHLQGDLQSQNYTRSGPVTAYTNSQAAFEGRRNLYANIGGFYVTDPYLAANLNSYFQGVSSRLRIINNVARKQYSKDKERAEGIAAARAEMRIDEEFRRETDQAFANARSRFGERLDDLNRYRGGYPMAYLSSHPEQITAVAIKSDAGHLGALTPPLATNIPSDIRLRIHESMLVNFIDPLFVAKKMTNEQMAERLEKLVGQKLDAFATETPEENWSITFAQVQPFKILFENGRLQLAIQGERFTQGSNTIRASLLIKATFKIIQYRGQLYFVRDGKVVVENLNPDDTSARTVGFKTFLENKLNQVPDRLPPEPGPENNSHGESLTFQIDPVVDGLTLPANLIPLDKIENQEIRDYARQLQLVELQLEQGWLSVAWRKAGPGQAVITNHSAIHQQTTLETPNEAPAEESRPGKPEPETGDPALGEGE